MSFRHVDCSKLLCVKKMFHFSFSCLSQAATTSERHQKKCQFFFFLSTKVKNIFIFQFSPTREIIHISVVIIAPRGAMWCWSEANDLIEKSSVEEKNERRQSFHSIWVRELGSLSSAPTRHKLEQNISWKILINPTLVCDSSSSIFTHIGANFSSLRESRRRLANAAQPKSENCRDRERIFLLFLRFFFIFGFKFTMTFQK